MRLGESTMSNKMKYSDRYKTLTVRFKPDEWIRLCEGYEAVKEEYGGSLSKHRFLKALIAAGLGEEPSESEICLKA